MSNTITPRENLERFFRRESVRWMPTHGDILSFRPRMHPDNYATHLVVDAEPAPEYDSDVAIGWFGLEWQFVPQAGGATVRPGHPTLTDMSEWEKVISIPDLDELDWEGSAKINHDYLAASDKMREVACLSGLWERLISLMDVDNAAIAMIDEDQQEGVHRFFSAMCDMYDEMIDRYARYYSLDMLMMHDDWGSQRAPFFSLDTCREMLVPYLKRIVDACHRNGLRFELHCCGKNELLVPAMIEAGVDLWCGQPMNDFDMLTEKYADSCLAFGVLTPVLPEDAAEEELRAAARAFFDHYKDRRAIITERRSDPRIIKLVREISESYYAS